MTGEHYRETATAPAYDLVLAVRRRRLRYLGHVLRMSADMDGAMRTHGTSVRLCYVSNWQPVQWLPGRCAATTCGNDVESCNVARQSRVAVMNLRF